MNKFRHAQIKSRAAVLDRNNATLFRNIVDAGICVVPLFQMACLTYGHNKTSFALGSAVVLSTFLHNHFLSAVEATHAKEYVPTRRSMQKAAENLRADGSLERIIG